MTKKSWKDKIKKACVDVGTYRPSFDYVIDTLAGILEARDNAQEKFDEMGGATVVKHTNKGGSTNIVKNPALVVIDDMNKTALQYWRDLGLTPAGLRRIDEKAMKPQRVNALAEAMKALNG